MAEPDHANLGTSGFAIFKRDVGNLSKDHHGPNRFVNPWPSFQEYGFLDFLKVSREWDLKKVTQTEERVQVVQPDLTAISQFIKGEGPKDKKFMLTWLGHAAMLLSSPGVNILFDPCFSDRFEHFAFTRITSEVCDSVFVQKANNPSQRLVPVPCKLEDLPHVDIVVISHNHLASPKTWFFVPLGNKKWFLDLGIQNVIEADCCDPMSTLHRPRPHGSVQNPMELLGVPKDTKDISSLPTCPAFKEIGEKYGPFDLAAIPIGAYSPRWFMSAVHCNPLDSVDLHLDIKSRKSIGMHWGTFVLTDEPLMEPPQKLKEALAAKDLDESVFSVVNIVIFFQLLLHCSLVTVWLSEDGE
ncbi:hypothetical protein HK102_009239 [Quaeritorhiza haematococci]|nr:hypothetical protein HK102_009239 [Quaeritorhiza haematococci]